MTTDLVPIGVMPSENELAIATRMATDLANSGMFKDAKSAHEAFAKIMLGRDLGLSPTQAMISLHVVEGKPELSANLQAQLVRTYRGPDGERYDFKVVECTDEVCAIEFHRRREGDRDWELLGVERFTTEDADRAGLTKPTRNGGPSMYAKYPRNMLWARAMSNGVNFHCPEVARGLRVFHEGEIDTPAPLSQPTQLADLVELASPEQITSLTQACKGLTTAQIRAAFFAEALGEPAWPSIFDHIPAERVDALTTTLKASGVEGAGSSPAEPDGTNTEGTHGAAAAPPQDHAAAAAPVPPIDPQEEPEDGPASDPEWTDPDGPGGQLDLDEARADA
jgi:hypothetical protein